MADIDDNKKLNNQNYNDKMYSYLQRVVSVPSDYFVFIFSGTTYIQEERGNRPIRQTRVLLKQNIPVFFSYWRWRSNEPIPEFPDQNLFQSPIDITLENIQAIANYDFKDKKKIFIITFPHPSVIKFLELLNKNGWITIYDARDDWEEFQKVGQAKWFDRSVEEYIVNHSDVVSAISKNLQQKIQSLSINKKVHLSPNALDSEFLTDGKVKISPRDGKPIIGYVGHLTSSWFDWQSVISAARTKPGWHFEIIGHHMPENLTLPPNVRYLGAKKHDEIKLIAKEWRAAIIPFKIGKLSDSVDPIKVYEYLCMGLPVVSFRMPQINDYPYVFIANDVDEFVSQIERALTVPMDAGVIEDFLSKNRWEDRIRQLMEWCEEKLKEREEKKKDKVFKGNSPLRILYLYKYGVLGGVSTQLINRMRYLKDYCEPHFGFIKDYGAMAAFGGYPHVRELPTINEIVSYINKHKFDVIIPIDTNEAYEAIKKSNFKGIVINEVHTTYEQNLRKIQALQQDIQIDAIITPSKYLQNRIIQDFKFERTIPTYVVENCLDTQLFQNQSDGDYRGKRVFLWVGKLDGHKNYESFLSIAHNIGNKVDGCEFWLVGGYTAPDKVVETLQARIKELYLQDVVKWLPRVSYNNMPKIYSTAANSGGCFISTSQNESFGMAIIEALACGCPCIVPDVGAISEVMDGDLSCCLYKSNNEYEAIEKISSLIKNHRTRSELIGSGRRKVLENYTLERAGKKYVDVLTNIINQQKNQSKVSSSPATDCSYSNTQSCSGCESVGIKLNGKPINEDCNALMAKNRMWVPVEILRKFGIGYSQDDKTKDINLTGDVIELILREIKNYDYKGNYLFFDKMSVENWDVEFDKNGIPKTRIRGGIHYYPITIAQYALQHYSLFLKNGDESSENKFLNIAQYLLETQDSMGGWPNSFDYTYSIYTCPIKELQAPWYSAMAQGQAISVLTRAYYLTGESKYLNGALDGIKLFRIPARDGGLLDYFGNHYPFYQEYPTDPPSYVLNGFMFSLIGLYDLYKTSRKEAVKKLYTDGINTLKRMIGLYDLGYKTAYDLTHYSIPGNPPKIARWQYHATHIHLLMAINSVEQDPVLEKVLMRWIGYTKGERARSN